MKTPAATTRGLRSRRTSAAAPDPLSQNTAFNITLARGDMVTLSAWNALGALLLAEYGGPALLKTMEPLEKRLNIKVR
jgi:hypothetical protein